MSTIREALEAAAGESSGDEATEAAPVEEVAALDSGGGDEGAAAGLEAAGDAPASNTEDASAETQSREAGRSRDGKGRFAPGSAEAAKATPAVTTKPALPGTTPTAVKPTVRPAQANGAAPATAEGARPPQSWRAEAREVWAKLPPQAQAEVHRREKEASIALQESAPARKFAESFNQVVSPYMGTIQAEGGNPLSAVSSLLQTAQALRTAPPAHKAALVANIIRQFGVPVESIAAHLDGQASGQEAQQGGGYQDPRVDALLQRLESAQQQRQQSQAAKAQGDVEEFRAKSEFLEDVKGHMRSLLMGAVERNRGMTLQEAYDMATWADPKIRGILQQRAAAEAANAGNASTQRARNAASSVKGRPAGASAPQQNGVREALVAAAARLSSR